MSVVKAGAADVLFHACHKIMFVDCLGACSFLLCPMVIPASTGRSASDEFLAAGACGVFAAKRHIAIV